MQMGIIINKVRLEPERVCEHDWLICRCTYSHLHHHPLASSFFLGEKKQKSGNLEILS